MTMNNDETMEVIMSLIMHGGDARSSAMEAIYAAKTGNFDLAKEKIQGADQSIIEAHEIQTNLLSNEASGAGIPVNLLLVHAQDHLMSAMTYRDLAEEMVDMYNRMNQ